MTWPLPGAGPPFGVTAPGSGRLGLGMQGESLHSLNKEAWYGTDTDTSG
jgi:hypothetical protein